MVWSISVCSVKRTEPIIKTYYSSVARMYWSPILSQYSGVWKRSYNWINVSENACETNRSLICDFWLEMYDKSYASSSLNWMPSKLNFFSSPSNDFANDILISRLFSYFYKKRPWIANYIVHWPVETVFRFLKPFHPVNQLSLKQWTIKYLALIQGRREGSTVGGGQIQNLPSEKKSRFRYPYSSPRCIFTFIGVET